MEKSENNKWVRRALLDCGIEFLGFADLTGVSAEARRGLKYGVCFGIPLNVFPGMGEPSEAYYREYKGINAKLKEVSLLLESKITERGFSAFSLARNKQSEDYRTVVPFKTLATRAGLGWIGKSSLLVTKKFGSAVRLNGIITDMPFETAVPLNSSYCGKCSACVDACPGNAIKGLEWSIGTDRDDLIDHCKCKSTVIERGKSLGVTVGSCGICISACPWTKRYIDKAMQDQQRIPQSLPRRGKGDREAVDEAAEKTRERDLQNWRINT